MSSNCKQSIKGGINTLRKRIALKLGLDQVLEEKAGPDRFLVGKRAGWCSEFSPLHPRSLSCIHIKQKLSSKAVFECGERLKFQWKLYQRYCDEGSRVWATWFPFITYYERQPDTRLMDFLAHSHCGSSLSVCLSCSDQRSASPQNQNSFSCVYQCQPQCVQLPSGVALPCLCVDLWNSYTGVEECYRS